MEKGTSELGTSRVSEGEHNQQEKTGDEGEDQTRSKGEGASRCKKAWRMRREFPISEG